MPQSQTLLPSISTTISSRTKAQGDTTYDSKRNSIQLNQGLLKDNEEFDYPTETHVGGSIVASVAIRQTNSFSRLSTSDIDSYQGLDESLRSYHHRRHNSPRNKRKTIINNNNNNNNNNIDNSNNNDEVKVRYNKNNNMMRNTDNIVNKIRKFFMMLSRIQCMNSTRLLVLVVLSLQNSLFTVLRRYSQGVLHEMYSKYEVLLIGELIKIIFSAYMIRTTVYTDYISQEQRRISSLPVTNSSSSFENNNNTNETNNSTQSNSNNNSNKSFHKVYQERIIFVIANSGKMIGLAIIYGIMNILSFVSLRNIGAGMFTIFAQCKILTTATFSTIILKRQYSYTKWRALASLMAGVILFSEPIWSKSFASTSSSTTTSGGTRLLQEVTDAVSGNSSSNNKQGISLEQASVFIGTVAVIIEVTLSGFASIYFEKVIKLDPLQLNIWERNFQLALGSFPVYLAFMAYDGGGKVGYFGGWSFMACVVSLLGAAGGILVALSIKYGDAILKTLATTAAIILSSFLDYVFLDGDLTPTMCIAGFQVIVAITDYTFDATPEEPNTKDTLPVMSPTSGLPRAPPLSIKTILDNKDSQIEDPDDDLSESIPLVEIKR